MVANGIYLILRQEPFVKNKLAIWTGVRDYNGDQVLYKLDTGKFYTWLLKSEVFKIGKLT